MLQRAASNAYNYWWASSIRSKQSKWLDSDLEEMDGKVHAMTKLIDQDADSFGKKAELYFRRRPELLSHVEEMYKSYKSLADKYDRISGELHKANHTLASICPEQVQFAMHDDDDDETKLRTPLELPPPYLKSPNKDGQGLPKKPHHRRISSQISKDKAQEEIDRLQKEILVLQTEKEFIKSSYQGTLNRFMQIEKEIADLQEEVCNLQDSFSTSSIIEDDEARSLMAATAIKSCEDSLANIKEQQRIAYEEARQGSERIKDAARQLNALKGEANESVEPKPDPEPEPEPEKRVPEPEPETEPSTENSEKNIETDSTAAKAEELNFPKGEMELQAMCEKIREHFEMSSEASVVELAEKIDALVDKVINLEVTVSTQTAQIQRMNSETDELHEHLKTLEEEKSALVDNSSSLAEKLKEAEDELERIQQLEKCIHEDKGILKIQFIEACRNLNNLSDKLLSDHQQEEETFEECIEGEAQSQKTQKDILEGELIKELMDIPDIQQLLRHFGLEGKEKAFLSKYRTIVLHYRDTKNKLMEIERKTKEYHFETIVHVKELKNASTIKDDEIRLLKDILAALQTSLNANVPPPTNVDNPSEEDGNKSESIDEPRTSAIEEKFRADIDKLIEENMDFWLRFSGTFHQIQKFQKTFKDIKAEIDKTNETENVEGNGTANANANADATASANASANASAKASANANPNANTATVKQEPIPFDKRLRELNTEFQVWLEKSALLNGELKSKYSSLADVNDEISRASNADETGEVNFSPYQAAKFQGEIRNMQLENRKIVKELLSGIEFVKGLQIELSWTLAKLNKKYELSARSNQNQSLMASKARVPLRTFLFGVKSKKPSLFACISPVMDKEYRHMRTNVPR